LQVEGGEIGVRVTVGDGGSGKCKGGGAGWAGRTTSYIIKQAPETHSKQKMSVAKTKIYATKLTFGLLLSHTAGYESEHKPRALKVQAVFHEKLNHRK